ncbi:MAG: hypothetical protein AB3N20_20485 [Rhizobiaceae bacterium]
MKRATSLLAGAICLALLPSGAAAQAMSPMRAEVQSFTDSFAVRVYPANPYEHRIRIEVKVYDQTFREVKNAVISPSVFTLGARFSRPVTVMVPFNGEQKRKVRICTESIPFPGQTTRIKAQVCGKFLGKRL